MEQGFTGVGRGRNLPDEQLLSVGIGAASGDPTQVGTAFYQILKELQEQRVAAARLEKRIQERDKEIRAARDSRAISIPFTYSPSDGVRRFSLGKVLKGRVNAISIITAAAVDPLSADPRDKIIYFNFDHDLHVPSATGGTFPRAEYPAPNSYELFIPVGGKLNQFAAVRDMDTIAVYSRQAFIGTIFITGGSPDILPGL